MMFVRATTWILLRAVCKAIGHCEVDEVFKDMTGVERCRHCRQGPVL